MRFKQSKKAAIPAMLISLLAIVGVVAVVIWGMNTFGGGKTISMPLSVGSDVSAPANNEVTVSIPAEDVTVTFSSWDFYAKGTNAGTGHRILSFNGDIGLQVNDDSSRQYSPGDSYIVLLGNKTTSLTGGTDYYPVLKQGELGNKGTATVGAGQYKVAGASQVTFTFFDNNGDTNTAVSIGANDEKRVSWKVSVNDNFCLGNPDTGGMNQISYTYNNTVFSKVAQLDSSGSEMTKVATPNSATVRTSHAIATFGFPVVCDNGEYKQTVLIQSLNVDADTNNDINMTFHDITWDFDADTLAPIKGVQDEDNNDIGVADFSLGNLIVS